MEQLGQHHLNTLPRKSAPNRPPAHEKEEVKQ